MADSDLLKLPRTTRPDLAKTWRAYVIFEIAVSNALGQALRSARAVESLGVKFPTFLSFYLGARNARDDRCASRTCRDYEELIR
jgi:hypothetical protein